jgi:hypothetical protein
MDTEVSNLYVGTDVSGLTGECQVPPCAVAEYLIGTAVREGDDRPSQPRRRLGPDPLHDPAIYFSDMRLVTAVKGLAEVSVCRGESSDGKLDGCRRSRVLLIERQWRGRKILPFCDCSVDDRHLVLIVISRAKAHSVL